ncbi:hypothetical protein PIB30_080027 [Stylosanthes scabra]|uniref:Putative plant transposon protein domain-containing protein n=1 Tax=Stylosanthes scabra TaxID=79078 RepID=A0ABU6QRF2_9FABA|nr:hypothetical protein [Stylosanthes scabra]
MMETREKEKECRKKEGKPEKGSRITLPPLKKKKKKEDSKPAKKKKKHDEVKSRKKKKKRKEDENEERIALKCSSLGNLIGKLKKIGKALHDNRKMDAHLMTSKGKGIARQPSSRTRGTSSRRQTSQEAERFETQTHAKRGQILSEKKVMHERTINFRGKQDTVREQIFARGWQFMYDPAIPINISLVREFYANRDQKNQPEVYIRGRKIPCHRGEIEGVLGIPRLEGKSEHKELGDKYDSDDLDLDEVMRVIDKDGATWPSIPGRINKKILNKEASMWMKLAVCSILLTRHETTLGVDHILLIYALMKGMTISLSGVMVLAMNDDPTKSKRQLLSFPMFITKWAEGAGVPTYPGDKIFNVPKAQQFFPYGLWKEERKAAEDPIPPPMPSPVRPLATHTDIPAPFTRNSPQPSRKELMRALRHNEHIMRRHEQLLLMLHPGTDIF